MKVDGYEIPDDLLYSKEHEWVKILDSSRALIGITDYAAKLLHDVVYVSLPSLENEFKQKDVLGSVESVKAVSDLYCPLSGKVVKVNEGLTNSPELINQSPYQEGWIVELSSENLSLETKALLTPEQYASLITEIMRETSK